MHFQFKPGIGTCVQPLTAHCLQVTVDRLHRMTIRAHFDGVHQPGVRTHGRPRSHDERRPRLRQDAGLINRALGGANNYSPLRPTAAPRRADQTHPPSPPARGAFLRVAGVVLPAVSQSPPARGAFMGRFFILPLPDAVAARMEAPPMGQAFSARVQGCTAQREAYP